MIVAHHAGNHCSLQDLIDKISKIRWRYKDIFRMCARSIREILNIMGTLRTTCFMFE